MSSAQLPCAPSSTRPTDEAKARAVLSATARSGEGPELRSTPREPAELSALLSSLEADADTAYTLAPATVLDVSGGGLRLLIDEALCVGQRVLVEVEALPGKWEICPGRVAWTRVDANGSHLVGVSLVSDAKHATSQG